MQKKVLNLSTKIMKNSFGILFRAFNSNKKEIVQFIRKESIGENSLFRKLSSEDFTSEKMHLNMKNESDIYHNSNTENNYNKINGKDNENDNHNELKDLSLKKRISKEIENLKKDEELVRLIQLKYGDKITNIVDFEEMSTKLIILSYILSLKKDNDLEDRNLITNSINLLSLIIISQNNIKFFLNSLFSINEDISKFIDDNEKILNKNFINDKTKILTFDNFILNGILRNNNIIIRLNFYKCFSNLCNNLDKIKEYSLNVFLLNTIKEIIFNLSLEEKTNSKYICSLFIILYDMTNKETEEYDIYFSEKIIEKIFNDVTNLPEELLNSYLKLLCQIFKRNKLLIDKYMQEFDLINNLIDNFILRDAEKFKNEFEELNRNRNENEDINSSYVNTSQINKFMNEKYTQRFSGETRNNIYILILIIINDNLNYLKTFFSGKLSCVNKFTSNVNKDKRIYNPVQEKKKTRWKCWSKEFKFNMLYEFSFAAIFQCTIFSLCINSSK
jgi:hypothetical protein